MSEDNQTPDQPNAGDPVSFSSTNWNLPSDQMVIRRYTDLEYLTNVLRDNELHFGQAEKYDDMNEGRATEAVREYEEENSDLEGIDFEGDSEPDFAKGSVRFREDAKSLNYLNCWRLGTDESAWHWNKFTGEEGVAFETTIGQLRRAISSDNEIYMGMVWYIPQDQPGAQFPPETYFEKEDIDEYRKEHEFRVSVNIGGSPVFNLEKDPDEEFPVPDSPDDETFINFNSSVVNRIITRPGVREDFFSRVSQTVQQYKIDAKVERSRLDWDQEPGPSHHILGNQRKPVGEEIWQEQLDTEVLRTDWDIWEVVDVVLVTPAYVPEEVALLATHAEVYRYSDKDDVVDPSEYGHDWLQQGRTIQRFTSLEDREFWEIKPPES